MARYEYDLAVIGTGPAGEKGAAQAAYYGKKVVVIEKYRDVGGACVNTGTLPSKTLRETALYLSGVRQRNLYGVSVELQGGLGARDLMCRQEPVRVNEIARIHGNFDQHHIDLLRGTAQFVDEHTLQVEGQLDAAGDMVAVRRLTADVILVATGSSPHCPSSVPFDDPDIDDSDTVLQIDRIPKNMVVLGAGVIGCEYASIFASLGVQVTLVDARSKLLPFLDSDMSAQLTRELRQLGIELVFDAESTDIERHGRHIRTRLSTGRELWSEKLLFAAGRNGNTAGLGLERIGVTPTKRGALEVDEHYQVGGTKDGRIYAAGDVIGFPALASTSMEQARVAMCHAFGFGYKQRISEHLPYGIYSIPEVAMVGETEESAQAKGIDVATGRASYGSTARGQIVGDLTGLLKLVFRTDDKRLLGVHIIGERATDLVHIGQMVLHFGGTLDDFIAPVFNYPTLSELYKTAAYNGLGNLARRKVFEEAEWEELPFSD